MAEGEKVDLLKAVKSVATPVYWVKTVMYCLGAFAIFFIVNGVYKYYFVKKPPTQTFEHVDKVVYEANKRKLILFAEPYIGVDTKQKASIGTRVGARWEF